MMYASTQKTPWYRFVLIVPVFMSLFFTFSCQPDEEEITRQAVAQSYDEVKNDIQLIDQEIQAVIDHHYPTQQAFVNALDEYRTQNPGSPPPSAVDLLKDKASAPVLSSLESLITRRDELREKMTHLPDAEGVYTVVENQPEPPSGIGDFYKYIGQNIKYPAQARRMGIEGHVFVQFDVDEYGELTNVKVLKGIGAGCDKEAVRVVEEATEWNPGTTDGKPVNVRMVMPITFKLDRASEDATSGKSENATSGKMEKIIVNPLSAADKPVTLSEIVVVAYIP